MKNKEIYAFLKKIADDLATEKEIEKFKERILCEVADEKIREFCLGQIEFLTRFNSEIRMNVVYASPEYFSKEVEIKDKTYPFLHIDEKYKDANFCKNCGKTISKDLEVCPYCNSNSIVDNEETLMECKHCGNFISPVNTFCPYCGNKLWE